MSRRPSHMPRLAVPALGGHRFGLPAGDASEGSPSASSVVSEPAWVDGRHPIVAASQDDASSALVQDFVRLSADMLSTIGVGIGQRIATNMCPPHVLKKEQLPVNRGEHVGFVRDRFTAYAFQIEALSTSINQLVALEHVMMQRLLIMETDLERHEATDGPVCLDCELCLDAVDQRLSRAAVQRALDTREEAIARSRVGLRAPFNARLQAPASGAGTSGAR